MKVTGMVSRCLFFGTSLTLLGVIAWGFVSGCTPSPTETTSSVYVEAEEVTFLLKSRIPSGNSEEVCITPLAPKQSGSTDLGDEASSSSSPPLAKSLLYDGTILKVDLKPIKTAGDHATLIRKVWLSPCRKAPFANDQGTLNEVLGTTQPRLGIVFLEIDSVAGSKTVFDYTLSVYDDRDSLTFGGTGNGTYIERKIVSKYPSETGHLVTLVKKGDSVVFPKRTGNAKDSLSWSSFAK